MEQQQQKKTYRPFSILHVNQFDSVGNSLKRGRKTFRRGESRIRFEEWEGGDR